MTTIEEEISRVAKELGADIVGFTDTDRLKNAPPSGNLKNVLASAQSAIGIAVALDTDAVYKFMRKEDYWSLNRDHQEAMRKLMRIGMAIKDYLEERGHDVYLPFANFQYLEPQEHPQRDMKPVLSHKYVCEAAGVGWTGWSGNLLTRDYGANVILASVVTSAQLVPSPLVKEDWCSACRICTAVCPTHYMPKQEADEVEIAGEITRYAHRRTALRCTITCGGSNCKRKDNSKWSVWTSDYIEGLPDAHESDEAFEKRVKEEVDNKPGDIRLKSLYEQPGLNNIADWETYASQLDYMLLSCSLCQLVCVPGMDKRQEAYRMIINSGHVLEDDPRMQPPADMHGLTEVFKNLKNNNPLA